MNSNDQTMKDAAKDQPQIVKPSFLVIGVQKAATSWLWVQMRKHPRIWMPPVKELHYFDHLFVEENQSWTKGHIIKAAMKALKWQVNNSKSANPEYLRYLVDLMAEDMFTEEWYLRTFARPISAQILQGDVTPEYCTIGEKGVQYVKELLPAAKIIMVVRDPVTRAESQLRMNISRRGIDPKACSDSDWEELSNESAIYNRAQYAEYIPIWEKYYDNIHYIPYKSISSRPRKVMSDLFEHIGLPDHNCEGLEDKVHAGTSANIPKKIIAKLQRELEPHQQFLLERFGKDFVKET